MSEFVYLYRGGEAGQISRENAAADAEVDGLVQAARRKRTHPESRPSAGARRQGREGQQKTVTDGPFAEAKDVIGGYTLVEARDIDQAVELSKGCPIFEFEGAVEVRPIMKMNM